MLAEAARYDRKLLIEAAVPNPREIECGVLGNDGPRLYAGRSRAEQRILRLAAKYLDGRSESRIPAPVTADQAALVRKLAVQAFLALDTAGLSRVDFLLDDVSGELYLNEVNTLPGFTSISMYPQLWAASGLPYTELIDRLIELALERHADRERSQSVYTGATPV